MTVVVVSLVETTAGLVPSPPVLVLTTGLVEVVMVSVVVSTNAGFVVEDSVAEKNIVN